MAEMAGGQQQHIIMNIYINTGSESMRILFFLSVSVNTHVLRLQSDVLLLLFLFVTRREPLFPLSLSLSLSPSVSLWIRRYKIDSIRTTVRLQYSIKSVFDVFKFDANLNQFNPILAMNYFVFRYVDPLLFLFLSLRLLLCRCRRRHTHTTISFSFFFLR